MDVRIRPAGYLIFAGVIIFLIYRLLYTLLWEHSTVVPSTVAPATVSASSPAISDWLVLAPISLEGEENSPKPTSPDDQMAKLLDTAYLPDEAHLNPKPGDKVQIHGKTLTWTAVQQKNMLDLVAAVKSSMPGAKQEATEHVVGYAVATVDAPKATTDAILSVGSDDGVKVWLNGTQVLEKAVDRSLKPGDDRITHLALNAGHNTLVFKVGQDTTNWQLSASMYIP